MFFSHDIIVTVHRFAYCNPTVTRQSTSRNVSIFLPQTLLSTQIRLTFRRSSCSNRCEQTLLSSQDGLAYKVTTIVWLHFGQIFIHCLLRWWQLVIWLLGVLLLLVHFHLSFLGFSPHSSPHRLSLCKVTQYYADLSYQAQWRCQFSSNEYLQ